MINAQELRLGNFILQKQQNKINKVACTYLQFEQLATGEAASMHPIVLKPEVLASCGFTENKDYPLAPNAREFILILPVNGSNRNELFAYIKNNGECFGRAMVDGMVASNNFYHLHQLQNLYFAITGKELSIKS